MKPFQYYLDKNDVRKISNDINLALSLKKDLIERAKKALKLDSKEFSKIVFENIYDSLREFCDSILAIDGYKSYSHEASIAYLKKYGFSDIEILALDRFRYKRNGSKYYGKPIDENDAEEIKEFYNNIKDKLNKLLDEKLG